MGEEKSGLFSKLKSFILGPEEESERNNEGESTDSTTTTINSITSEDEERVEKKLNPKFDDTIKPMAVKKVIGFEDSHSPVINVVTVNKPEPEPAPNTELDVLFAEHFTAQGGKFIFAETKSEFVEILKQLKQQFTWQNLYYWEDEVKEILEGHDTLKISIGCTIENAQAAVSMCEYLIANDGSILLSSKQASTRGLSVFPDAHIIIADASRLVYNLEAGVKKFNKRHGSELPFIIYLNEKSGAENKAGNQLILNATGTKNIFVVFVDEKVYNA